MRILHPLALLRRQNQLTQTKMAEETGVPCDMLGRFERGQQIPDYFQAKRIADTYNLKWHVIIENCVEYQQTCEQMHSSWLKNSEPSTYSSVCINQKCETGCTN